ncbi:MAG: M13 family metallopeptidase N-terminal domain-containing protein, partial [Bacillota bacterium]|nr:M13 family metallopeptidase N-terminal domain-containing protein [Bacillota bacterium]
MNPEVTPGTDFYQYACGGWIKNNPLKPEYSRYGSFDAVSEANREQLKQLIEELSQSEHAEGSVAQKIGDVYAMMMDSARLNKDGVKPILADMERISKVQTRAELHKMMGEYGQKGAQELFGSYIGADMMDSKNNILEVGQSGLTLGQKDYYLNDDEATVKIREAFKCHIVKMFQLVG